MKLTVLALDYDGTITRDDRPDPSVLDAMAEARRRGIAVMLVTGRRLDDLRRVAGDLHFADGVVAENGALLHFPDGGLTTTLAPPIPPEFVARLQKRGIPFQAGQCLIEADATSAPQLLDAIRELELPIVLLFNRGRVMALAQGISKATGLSAALETLRKSPHNAIAVGDAENDHELLRLAEVGAAVEWGSPSLRAAADIVIPGDGPPAVAGFIRHFASLGRMPTPSRARRRLILGRTDDGREFSLALRGRNVLIMGETNSGKSWLAGLLCERLILQGYSLCVIDPEGDYRTLDALPGVRVLGGEDEPPPPRALLHALRYPDRSVVIDLSGVEHGAKFEYIRSVLPELNVMRRRLGTPHRIVVDEGHYFLRDAVEDARSRLQRLHGRDLLALAATEGARRRNGSDPGHEGIEPRGNRSAPGALPRVPARAWPRVGRASGPQARPGRRPADYYRSRSGPPGVHDRGAPHAARAAPSEVRGRAGARQPRFHLSRRWSRGADTSPHAAGVRRRARRSRRGTSGRIFAARRLLAMDRRRLR